MSETPPRKKSRFTRRAEALRTFRQGEVTPLKMTIAAAFGAFGAVFFLLVLIKLLMPVEIDWGVIWLFAFAGAGFAAMVGARTKGGGFAAGLLAGLWLLLEGLFLVMALLMEMFLVVLAGAGAILGNGCSF